MINAEVAVQFYPIGNFTILPVGCKFSRSLQLIANNTNHTNLPYYTYIVSVSRFSNFFFSRFISPILHFSPSIQSLSRFLCLSIRSLCIVYIYVWPSIEIAQHYFSLHNNSETLARNLYGCFLRDLDLNFRPEFARGILSLWSTMLVEWTTTIS